MCQYGPHRADSPPGDELTITDGPATSDDQRREWRRWVVEAVGSADAGVVPVDHLVDLIADREPEETSRSTIRTALTGTVLPALDREPVFEYDADRELLIKYT
ncbi:hypothetical protein [Halohasta salina]|uniref:hypothetical protein n=1 Tax=Halohasta salina TaxID=2961621 RepID=UPI0020A3590A|nr:hypothetical protein [Halohasta salina]